MSLQGSIHKWSDGIGYGAFIPTERAYYNVRERRPSHAATREYRRHNVTAGIDTHRSNISFGRSNESVRGGTDGHSRAREATKSLTSGEVGGFCWPAERAREGDVETILASVSSNASLPPAAGPSSARSRRPNPTPRISARSVQQIEQAAQEKNSAKTMSARCRTACSSGGASTQRSSITTASASSRSSCSYHNSRLSSSRLSSYGADSNDGNSSSGHRTRRPVSHAAGSSNDAARSTGQPSSRRSAKESRLRPLSLGQGDPLRRQEERYQGGDASSSRTPRLTSSRSLSDPKLPSFRALDPSFDRHHKYDVIAHDRAASGGEITGRFGPVRGSSVVAASLLTSELSTPWSHVLRGQKW
ncbi:unnamed protein product [Laminaria digitata]